MALVEILVTDLIYYIINTFIHNFSLLHYSCYLANCLYSPTFCAKSLLNLIVNLYKTKSWFEIAGRGKVS